MLKVIAIVLNILLVLVGLLSLLSINLCGILAGLGAGIPNLILLSRGSIEGVTEKIGIAGNTAAIIVGLVQLIIGLVYVFSSTSSEAEVLAGWMMLGFSFVFLSAGAVTAVVIANTYGVGR